MLTNDPGEMLFSPIDILLVEDDDEDVQLMMKTLAKDRVLGRICRVEDGVEAMALLRREGKYRDAARPDLILLDLNMPRKDGREVLAEIKADDVLSTIPVVILTTSDSQRDILHGYSLKANSYVTKPVALQKFQQVLQGINAYWFTIVKLPQPTPDMPSLH
jgi:CheY-like chemotaxis protein